ncbi:MAG: hypothetical protein VZS44_06365 [Bacilli bacterium]|nr:hypothetical protein [Bacilli bacterium]
MKRISKNVNTTNRINKINMIKTPINGTSALKPQTIEKTKTKALKRKYIKPKANIVGMSTQQSPVMGCWNCGSDGIHC